MKRMTIAVLTALLMLLVAQPLMAGTYLNTIDDEATRNPSGHNVVVTGPIGCDAGEIVTIRVVVTQDTTGAVAQGTFHARCTGDRQPWRIHAATRGPVAFVEGPARVEAWAQTYNRGKITDTNTWWRSVDIVDK